MLTKRDELLPNKLGQLDLVYADTGEKAPDGAKFNQYIDRRKITTYNLYRRRKVRNRLVLAKSGSEAPLGLKKGNWHEGEEVVTFQTYIRRNKENSTLTEKRKTTTKITTEKAIKEINKFNKIEENKIPNEVNIQSESRGEARKKYSHPQINLDQLPSENISVREKSIVSTDLVYADKGKNVSDDVENEEKNEQIEHVTYTANKKKKPNTSSVLEKESSEASNKRRQLLRDKSRIKRNDLVYMDTGERAPVDAINGEIYNERKITTYANYKLRAERNVLVLSEDGTPAPNGLVKGQRYQGQEVITSFAYKERKKLCLEISGKDAPPDAKKGDIVDGEKVISKLSFNNRNMLVYKETGKPAPLGAKIGITDDGQEIITRGSYRLIKYPYISCWVLEKSGKKVYGSFKEGDKIDGELLIKNITYTKRIWVYAKTGKYVDHKDITDEAIAEGRITHRCDYDYHKNKKNQPKQPQSQTKVKTKIQSQPTHKVLKNKLRKKIDNTDNIKEKKIPNKVNKESEIKGGIGKKYLPPLEYKGKLPYEKSSGSNKPVHNNTIDCIEFRKLSPNIYTLPKQHDIEIKNDEMEVKFRWISSYSDFPSELDAVTFIMAGRGENAHVPQDTDNTRTILVLDPSQVDTLQKTFSPDIEFLIVTKMQSSTHGDYKELNLISVRRLAALIFSCHFNLSNCIMMDDNIKTIHFTDEKKSMIPNWSHFYFAMHDSRTELKSVSASVSTIRHYSRTYTSNTLGSKLFMLDIKKIQSRLKIHELFLLQYPAKYAFDYAEDYFMQIMLKKIFEQDKISGYQIIPPEKMGLIRSALYKNQYLQAHHTKAEQLLERNWLEELNTKHIAEYYLKCIEESISQLKIIVENNIQRQNASDEKKKNCDLPMMHLAAQGLLTSNSSLFKPNEKIPNTILLQRFKENIMKYDLNSILRKYQIDALNRIQTWENLFGLFNLETGTGKTMLLFAISRLLYETNGDQPIYIVTPTIQLVQQCYDAFIQAVSLFEKNREETKLSSFPVEHIIKVSSDASDVSASLLSVNNSLKNKNIIYIICENSFLLLLKNNPEILNPAFLLLDESHIFTSSAIEKIKCFSRENKVTTFAFTATPKNEKMPIVYSYSRQKALTDGVLSPLYHDRFLENYSEETLQLFKEKLPLILKNHLHPSGAKLNQLKGIIYFPPGTKLDIIQRDLKGIINCYAISHYVTNNKERTQDFIKDEKPTVALAINLLTVGMNDPRIDYIIIAQNANKNPQKTAQQVGRVIRGAEYINKVAYVLTFKDADLSMLKLNKDHADESAHLLAHKNYRMTRKARSLHSYFDDLTFSPLVEASDNKILNDTVGEQSKEELFYQLGEVEQQLSQKSSLHLFPGYIKPTGPFDHSDSLRKEMLKHKIIILKEQLCKAGVPLSEIYKRSSKRPLDTERPEYPKRQKR